jgi:hypothetical protein
MCANRIIICSVRQITLPCDCVPDFSIYRGSHFAFNSFNLKITLNIKEMKLVFDSFLRYVLLSFLI